MDATEATTETSPPDTPPGFGEPDPAEDPNRYPYATWSPWAAVGGSVAALILGVMLALPVIWAAGSEDFDDLGWGAKALVQLCTAVGFLAVPLLFAKQLPGGVDWRQALGRLGFHSFQAKTAAKWIGIGFLAYIVFAIAYAIVFGAPEQDDIAGELGPVWTQILLIVLIAPFVEEVCFRGMLFGGFRTRFNLPVAAIGAGLVFGLLHYSTGITAVPQLIVLGAIFAVVYEKTESIWPPIIFHVFNNAYALVALNLT
jgi:membrane protease YdiL (CAAX protease family)